MDISNLKIKKLKKELFAAALSVGVAAVALGSSTYAWYVTNNTVDGTTSTISALANGMVLQIVEGDTPDHGSDTSTIASGIGHEISPSSTNDITNWYVPENWKGTDVNTYLKPTLDATGKYTLKNQKDDFYAYTVSKYTLYTVNNTGLADVYLDNSTANGPVTITPSDGATQEWFDKIKGSLRIGIVIDNKLKVVYAPTLLFVTNQAYVLDPSATAATHTMAIAAASCFFSAFTFFVSFIFFPPIRISARLS